VCLGYIRTRLALVLWQEGVRPAVAIELLSPGIQDEDLGRKSLKVSNLENGRSTSKFWCPTTHITFNRYNDELQAFGLAGSRYQAMELLAKDLDA